MRKIARASLACWLLMWCTAQTKAPLPRSVVFFSPNTTDGLSDADALAGLKSIAEANAIAVADRAACGLGKGAEIEPSLGVFDKVAENSAVALGAWDAPTAAYLSALLGRYERQEWAFWFTADASGKERLWRLDTNANLAEVFRQIRLQGQTPATAWSIAGRNEILIVGDGAAAGRVAKLATALHATVASEPGTSGRMGSSGFSGIEGARATAPIYDAAIAKYEQARNVTLSRKLWTVEWHDATSRSCTSGK